MQTESNIKTFECNFLAISVVFRLPQSLHQKRWRGDAEKKDEGSVNLKRTTSLCDFFTPGCPCCKNRLTQDSISMDLLNG